jgi:hypothetical protein
MHSPAAKDSVSIHVNHTLYNIGENLRTPLKLPLKLSIETTFSPNYQKFKIVSIHPPPPPPMTKIPSIKIKIILKK